MSDAAVRVTHTARLLSLPASWSMDTDCVPVGIPVPRKYNHERIGSPVVSWAVWMRVMACPPYVTAVTPSVFVAGLTIITNTPRGVPTGVWSNANGSVVVKLPVAVIASCAMVMDCHPKQKRVFGTP